MSGQLETWRPTLLFDETTGAGQNSKTFTVPDRRTWKISWIWAELTSNGSVGNRQLVVQIQDTAADVIYEKRAGAVQAASVTRFYLFYKDAADMTGFRDTDFMTSPIVPFELPEGYIIRVFDEANIDSTDEAGNSDVDDLILQMVVQSKGERRRIVSAANQEPSS